jgi:hypothetical protein
LTEKLKSGHYLLLHQLMASRESLHGSHRALA